MQKRRFLSLDVFRGVTIALMLLVNHPGSWSFVYSPLRHAPWHGLTPTDLVFPFFLFIVGASMAFSIDRYQGREKWIKVGERTLTLFLLGLALNAFPFVRQNWDYSNLRIMGVLQRIGLCYGASALIIHYWPKRLARVQFSILGGYWLLFLFSELVADAYSLEGNPVGRLDALLFGPNHLWTGNGLPFDPEGLLSTLPAICSVLFGYQFGIRLRMVKPIPYRDLWRLAAWLTLLGGLAHFVMPINKQLWTSSYVMITSGLAGLGLTGLTWLIEAKRAGKWCWPLEIFGTNSIFVFVASGLWIKVLLKTRFELRGEFTTGYKYLFETVYLPLAGPLNASLLFALTHVVVWWLVLFELNRRKIHIKI